MNLKDFLDEVVNRGIAAAQRDYKGRKQEGAIAGFEACRDKTPQELKGLLESSRIASEDAHKNKKDYWWFRCYEAEVEWVCNVVSVVIVNQKWGKPLIPPTARAAITAQSILMGKPVI